MATLPCSNEQLIDAPTADGVFGPQSIGRPNGVRLIYVPDPEGVILSGMRRDVDYAASWLDPVTGAEAVLPAIRADQDGRAECAAPKGHAHDWVLIMQPR